MERNYGLTNTEMEIMELLWSVKEPLPFRELIRYANEEWNKNWKKQTLNTYLNHLQKMGINMPRLIICTMRSVPKKN